MGVTNEASGGDGKLMQRYNVLVALGDCHATAGNPSPAKECYEQAAELEPDRAEPYIGLGVLALQNEDLVNAEAAFRVAVRLDGCSAKAWCGLGMICQTRQQFAEAQEHYLRSLDKDCDNLTALLGLFQSSCQMGSFSKVIHYLEVYLEMHPGDTAVMFCLATLYVRDGRLQEARKLLWDVLTFSSDNSDAANLLEEVENKLSVRKSVGAASNG
ncbi:MAG TPA: tetratricopeptide repeat protein [Sedimentisphaerales bacterium]|nr:tetratricopeptide repeat protein [Sedimentisphaerales bacterium]